MIIICNQMCAIVHRYISGATFFASYELTKNILNSWLPQSLLPGVYMASAAVGEVVS